MKNLLRNKYNENMSLLLRKSCSFTNKRDLILSICTFVSAIISCLAIRQEDTTLAPQYISKFLIIINYLCVFISFLLVPRLAISNNSIFKILIVFFFLCMNVFNTAVGVPRVSIFLNFALLTVFSLLNREIYYRVYIWFRYFLYFTSILSLFAYVDFIFNFGLPKVMVPYYFNETTAMYVNYYFSYIYSYSYSDGFRLCGLFNEPGYFGTFLGLAIVLDKLRFNWKNIVMIIAGCLTFSMAYFVILITGIILFSTKSIIKLIVISSSLFILYVNISNIRFGNEQLQYLVERFQFDKQNGNFKGDNRTEYSFKITELKFKQSGQYLFGLGTGYCNAAGVSETLSYKRYIIEWGYVGFFITYGLLIIIAIKEARINRSALIFIFCFTLSIYQRPNIFSVGYFLLLFGGIEYAIRKSNINFKSTY